MQIKLLFLNLIDEIGVFFNILKIRKDNCCVEE